MVCRSADVGPNGLPHQIIWVGPEFFPQQCFHGWPDTVNDRPEVRRVVFRRTPKFLQGGQNSPTLGVAQHHDESCAEPFRGELDAADLDRKSTRLNSNHGYISYAVFCLKKKKKNKEVI